jgi:hypothetical protein
MNVRELQELRKRSIASTWALPGEVLGHPGEGERMPVVFNLEEARAWLGATAYFSFQLRNDSPGRLAHGLALAAEALALTVL